MSELNVTSEIRRLIIIPAKAGTQSLPVARTGGKQREIDLGPHFCEGDDADEIGLGIYC